MGERTPERLNAHLDGALDAAGAADVDRWLEQDADARASFAALRDQRDALDRAFAPLVAEFEGKAATWVAPHAHRVSAARPTWFALAAPIIAAAVFGFVAGALWFRAPSDASAPAALAFARIDVATGHVEARAAGATTFAPVANDAVLSAGTTLRTTSTTKAALALQDGSRVRVDTNTIVTLTAPRHLALDAGKVFSDVAADSSPFVIACDRLDITALGTTFEVERHVGTTGDEAGKDVAHVRVLAGRVRVGASEIGAGFGVRAIDGTPGAATAIGNLTILTRWVHELVLLEGDRSDELSGRVNEMLAMLGRTKMAHLYEWEIRSLGDHCVLPLTRFVQSTQSKDDAYRRREAARIACEIASPAYLDVLVELLDDGDADVRLAAAHALLRLTGTNRGYDDDYWRGASVDDGRASWRAWIRTKA